MNINLTDWQSEVFQDKSRYKVLRCGRRAGKTYLSVTILIYEAMNAKGDYWFIAPFYRQAKQIAWKMLNELLPPEAIHSKNETELSVELHNGSLIELKGADNPDSLRGVGLDGVVMDEYAKTRPFVWEEIVRPMLLDRGGWAMFIATPYGYNHFYDLWEEVPDKKDWTRWHFTSYDNKHIDKEEIDEAKQTMSEEKFQQEIMAEFTKKSGAVWPMFSREHHIVKRREPEHDTVIYGSIDFGFAVGHPTCFLLHEVDNIGNVYTFDGFMEEGMDISKIIEQIKAMVGGMALRGIFADSARPDLIDTLNKAGLSTTKAVKDVELGTSKVGEYMNVNPLTNKPRWTIAEHLKDVIRQIENYEWMEVRGEDGKFKQVPRKEADDSCDSLRYMIATYQKPKKRRARRQLTGGNPITGYGKVRI